MRVAVLLVCVVVGMLGLWRNAGPARSMSGSPASIATSAWSGKLARRHAYVTFVDPQSGAVSVHELPLDGIGPTRVLVGPQNGSCLISAITVDAAGYLYVSTGLQGGPYCYPTISVYAPGASGNAPPVRVVTGSRTRLLLPAGMAVDSSGKLYVADPFGPHGTQASIDIFAAGANGNVAPVGMIIGRNTQLLGDYSLALDAKGEIFAGEVGQIINTILKFRAGAHGDVAPVASAQLGTDDSLEEVQVAGSTVYASDGYARKRSPGVYRFCTSDLSPLGELTYRSFSFVHSSADRKGMVFVQNLIFTKQRDFRAEFMVFPPGHTKPTRVAADGQAATPYSGYLVLGP